MLGLVLLAAAASGSAEALVPATPPPSTGEVPAATGAAVVPPTELPAPRRFHRGVVVGLQLGAGAVGASGYPNNVSLIGNPAYYSASGVMVGTQSSLMLMGAFTDYLSFGFWYAHATSSNHDWQSRGDGGGLRVEVFPLVGLARPVSGFGTFAEFGLGGGRLSAKIANLPAAEGTQSFIGTGAFYEWTIAHLLGGHLAAGPSLEFDAIWSRPFERHGLMATGRIVFYGGP